LNFPSLQSFGTICGALGAPLIFSGIEHARRRSAPEAAGPTPAICTADIGSFAYAAGCVCCLGALHDGTKFPNAGEALRRENKGASRTCSTIRTSSGVLARFFTGLRWAWTPHTVRQDYTTLRKGGGDLPAPCCFLVGRFSATYIMRL